MLYSTFKAADLAGANINVNCIVPGLIYTPLWEMGATASHALALQRAQAGTTPRLPKGSPNHA